MRSGERLLVALGGVLVVLAGCGGGDGYSDEEISKAIRAEGGEVDGDPFCVVADILNDAEEIDEISRKQEGSIIASVRGNVGVVVEPPFPDNCARIVRDGLNRLDQRKKSE